ncbi:MAG TPA: hypothetical protein VGM78_01835, partial [Ilumatobacteraceae bacterium]
MSVRRTLIVVAAVAGLVASIIVGQRSNAVTLTRFSTVPFASRPYASHRSPITTTWYCGGVPGMPAASGSAAAGSGATSPTAGDGDVVMVNPTDVPLNARITLFGSASVPVMQSTTVPALGKVTFDV